MNRRNFLRLAAGSAAVAAVPRDVWSIVPWLQDEDALLCQKKFELAVSMGLQQKPIGDVIVEIGKTFLGTPYQGFVIEEPGEEHLVINMRALDCVSFYENCIVLARCIKKNTMTFEDYRKEFLFLRYRGGVINGYPSRLHYSSDYFYDGEQKAIWRNITEELGGKPFVKTLNFMSTHPESYRQIRESEEVLRAIRKIEEEISARRTFYIPKEDVAAIVPKLHNGDIIATTTDIEGIDTSHTGILIWQDGVLRFMHAPLAGGKVEISESALPEYLARNKRQTGIMVVRPLEPV